MTPRCVLCFLSGVFVFYSLLVSPPAMALTQTEAQKLLSRDAAVNEQLGRSVSISGDTALIGTAADGENGFRYGSAYVYRLENGAWVEQQRLTASDRMAEDQFGYSVSISGDTVLIGAYNANYNEASVGSAYVFRLEDGVWVERQKLIASDADSNDFFGRSVSISEDTALIGADGDNVNGLDSGSVYVFRLQNGVWLEQQKLTASDGSGSDGFGGSVSINADTALIGADADWNLWPSLVTLVGKSRVKL